MSGDFIHKDVIQGGYTMFSTALIQKKGVLSWQAKMILLFILSHSKDWRISEPFVHARGVGTRHAVHKAFMELERAGHLVALENPSGKKVVFCKGIWKCYETPVPEGSRSNRTGWKGRVAKPKRQQPKRPQDERRPSNEEMFAKLAMEREQAKHAPQEFDELDLPPF